MDADDRSLAPIKSFVSPAAHFVAYQEDYGTLGNNFLGANSNHPVLRLALELGVRATNRGDHDVLWLSTGPALLTRAFAQLIADPALSFVDTLDTTIILELGDVQKYIGMHCPAQYKKTQMHWHRSSLGKRSTHLSASLPREQ